MDALWIIEESRNGRHWHYYSTEEDAGDAEEIRERLQNFSVAYHQYRAVQYVRDESTVVDRPRMVDDPHSAGRECASVNAIEGNHCQHYHRGGKCCDCGAKFTDSSGMLISAKYQGSDSSEPLG